MPHIHLTEEQQGMLTGFVEQEPIGRPRISDGLAELLEKVMRAVNVRRLELVDPAGVRELLQSTFETMKLHHLHDNGLLSTAQLKAEIDAVRGRVAQID